MTLVSSRLTSPQNSKGNIGSEGVEWKWGRKNRKFLANKSPYLKNGARYNHSYNDRLIGSRIRTFDMVPKSSTLDDLEWPKGTMVLSGAEKTRLSEHTAQIWMKIDVYMQRQKCRPMTLVSGHIRYMWMLAGGEPQMRVGWFTAAIFSDLSGYFFGNFRDKASNIIWRYATPCLPVSDCKMNDLEWPWVAISRKTRFSH